MKKRELFQPRLIRVRRRRPPYLRYAAVGLIALLLLTVLVLLAFVMQRSSNQGEESVSASSSLPDASLYSPATDLTTRTVIETTSVTSATTAATTKVADDAYFADACFIGDSRTQGLILYSAPKTATSFASKGMTVSTFFTEKTVDKKWTVEQALKEQTFGKVYIMLGLNELGWQSSSAFIKRYSDLIDSVKESQPDANIFVQSILPVSKKKSESDKNFNNPRVLEYNRLIYDLCVEKQVSYLRVNEAVEDKKGYLPDDATVDGIHMNRTYCDKWLHYLRTHTDFVAAAPTVKTEEETTAVDTGSATQSTAADTPSREDNA